MVKQGRSLSMFGSGLAVISSFGGGSATDPDRENTKVSQA